MPRKSRKNPLPKKVWHVTDDAEDEEQVVIDPGISHFPDPSLNLPEDPEQRAMVLQKTPMSSLYKENDLSSLARDSTVFRDDKYYCLHCDKGYKTMQGLKYHVTLSCNKSKRLRFTCLVCGEQQRVVEQMTKHILDAHLQSSLAHSKPCTRVRPKMPAKLVDYLSTEEEEDLRARTKEVDEEDYVVLEEEDEYEDTPMDVGVETEKSPKKLKAKKSHAKPTRVTGPKAVSFAKVDDPLVEAMPWVMNRMNELKLNCEICYPMLLPLCNDYKIPMGQEERIPHLPQSKSPPFRIDRENHKKTKMRAENTECEGLDPLRTLPVEKEHCGCDFTFNAGDPVWALSWCPTDVDCPGARQYVALSTHSNVHSFSPCYYEAGLIQIWDCGRLDLHSHANECPEFCLGLAHHVGPIWDLRWCPLGGQMTPNNKDSLRRIGLLAAASASGKVIVISVPDPRDIKLDEDTGGNNSDRIFRLKPAMTLVPYIPRAEGVDEEFSKSFFSQCLCVSWSLADGAKWLVGGFSTGMVALWKMHEPSSLLLSDENSTLAACRTFRAHFKAVRGISWCPFDEDAFATGGMDRFFRVWNKKNPNCPAKESTWKGSVYHELHWPLIWCGIYAATDNAFAGPSYHGALYHDGLHNALQPTAVIQFKSSCWSVSSSDWMNCVVGSDAMGQTVIHVCSNWNRYIQQGKKLPTRIRVFSTDVIWTEETQDKDAQQTNSENREPEDLSSQKYKLIFNDTDFSDLSNLETRKCYEEVRIYENFPMTECKKPLVQSVNRVSWNPNFGSHTWIASGTHSGLVRLHCVNAMHSDKMDKFVEDNLQDGG